MARVAPTTIALAHMADWLLGYELMLRPPSRWGGGADSSSPLHLVSSRVAALRAVGRTSDRLSGAALSVQDKRSCVRLRPGGPSRCLPFLSLPLSFFSSLLLSLFFIPVPVWRFWSRSRRDVGDGGAAKMNTGEIRFAGGTKELPVLLLPIVVQFC